MQNLGKSFKIFLHLVRVNKEIKSTRSALLMKIELKHLETCRQSRCRLNCCQTSNDISKQLEYKYQRQQRNTFAWTFPTHFHKIMNGYGVENLPSRDCLNFLHAAWKHAGQATFFTKQEKFQAPAWKHFVGLQYSLHYLNED